MIVVSGCSPISNTPETPVRTSVLVIRYVPAGTQIALCFSATVPTLSSAF